MAQKVAVAAAQKVWAGMVNKDSPENGQLVKTITDLSGKTDGGSYSLQLTQDTSVPKSMWNLVSSGFGAIGTNMSMIVIWGLDEPCYMDLMKAYKISGGLSLLSISVIVAEHEFYPGDLEDIDRFSVLGQTTVRYRVVKK
jgi:hypothetical protein